MFLKSQLKVNDTKFSKFDDSSYNLFCIIPQQMLINKFVLFLFFGTQNINTMTRTIYKLTYLTWCLKATLGSITLLKDLRKTFSLLLRRSLASKTLSLNLTS